MPLFLPQLTRPETRVMMFVDGENLALRYKEMLGDRPPVSHVEHVPDVMVWSRYLSRCNGPEEYVRRHYYTSAPGDEERVGELGRQLKVLGIEAPRVFKRRTGRGSKRVDITLATEMLTHAHRRNFDVAVLVSGDGDFVPLVEAVQAEGRRVAVWSLKSGLSSALLRVADHHWDIGDLLFREEDHRAFAEIYG